MFLMKKLSQIKGLFAFVSMCIFTVLGLFLFTVGQPGEMKIGIEEHFYHIASKEDLDAELQKNFPTGFYLKTVYDVEKSMFVPFSELGVSYLSPKQEKYVNFFLEHKTLYKVWKAIPVKKSLEPIQISQQNLYYDKETLNKSISEQSEKFRSSSEDAFLMQIDGQIQVIPEKNGFQVITDDLADTLLEAIENQNYDNVFVTGELLFPDFKTSDISKYKLLLNQIVSDQLEDTSVQDNLLYIFSSLNNMRIPFEQQLTVSNNVENRIAVLSEKSLFDEKTKKEVNQLFDHLFDSLKQKGFIIEQYQSDTISIGEQVAGNHLCPVLKIKNNKYKSIIFSCYIKDNQLNLLVIAEK